MTTPPRRPGVVRPAGRAPRFVPPTAGPWRPLPLFGCRCGDPDATGTTHWHAGYSVKDPGAAEADGQVVVEYGGRHWVIDTDPLASQEAARQRADELNMRDVW